MVLLADCYNGGLGGGYDPREVIDMVGDMMYMVGKVMNLVGEVKDNVCEVMDMVGEMKAIVREVVDGHGWGSDGHVQGMKDMVGEVMD